ncbi:MAG: hypothetical protein JWO24_1541 [Rhodospirillales bacterium]|jgi:hypothetical protein|nr:hypothetical protein [Rhodospirillales bacterium]
MPLSAPAERDLLHLRDIELRGYQRADGLFDIEAHLTDTKSYGFANDGRGWIEKGEALHGMWIRLTLDEDMLIHSCEAASDFTPYPICPQAAPNFAALAGLKIGPGFNRAVKERVGGVLGCTHLREVLGQVATVTYQTLYPVRMKREREARERRAAEGLPPEVTAPRLNALIGTCLAYAPDSPVVLNREAENEATSPPGS